MRIKFTAAHMEKYRGVDGLGGMLVLTAGEEAEVSESVAKLLLQKYARNFEVVVQKKPDHAPTSDKLLRKGHKTKTK